MNLKRWFPLTKYNREETDFIYAIVDLMFEYPMFQGVTTEDRLNVAEETLEFIRGRVSGA